MMKSVPSPWPSKGHHHWPAIRQGRQETTKEPISPSGHADASHMKNLNMAGICRHLPRARPAKPASPAAVAATTPGIVVKMRWGQCNDWQYLSLKENVTGHSQMGGGPGPKHGSSPVYAMALRPLWPGSREQGEGKCGHHLPQPLPGCSRTGPSCHDSGP